MNKKRVIIIICLAIGTFPAAFLYYLATGMPNVSLGVGLLTVQVLGMIFAALLGFGIWRDA